VLEEILEKDLVSAAERQGAALKGRLEALGERYPFIGDVRGKGLLLAFEFVADRETMEPLPVELDAHLRLVEEAYSRGLIIYSRRTRGGFIGDHFLVCPPLNVTDAELDEIMAILVDSIDAFADESDLPVNRGA
jgi:4-aminobutyrate aminotransferase-like enzyme